MREKTIILLLRIIATFELLAIPFMAFPMEWMAVIHGYVDVGDFPRTPIVSYLARSLCLFYAIHGAITMFITFELRRYWQLLRFWAVTLLVAGVAMLGIDLAARMPIWWTLSEGPCAVLFGLLILMLQKQSERAD